MQIRPCLLCASPTQNDEENAPIQYSSLVIRTYDLRMERKKALLIIELLREGKPVTQVSRGRGRGRGRGSKKERQKKSNDAAVFESLKQRRGRELVHFYSTLLYLAWLGLAWLWQATQTLGAGRTFCITLLSFFNLPLLPLSSPLSRYVHTPRAFCQQIFLLPIVGIVFSTELSDFKHNRAVCRLFTQRSLEQTSTSIFFYSSQRSLDKHVLNFLLHVSCFSHHGEF